MSILSACLSSTEPAGSNESGTSLPNSSNRASIITGSPDPAILVGDSYSFTPTATDPDGDTLSFSIRNRPRWATFDSSTGRLRGQVLLGDQGIYSQIEISVTDGTSTTWLPAFSITVTDSALGSMTLSWTPPTENTDGTALTNLAGYNIYYGTRQGDYPNRISVNNPSISTYLVENLLPDTYYVVATSFNSTGFESSYSGVAVKTVSTN